MNYNRYKSAIQQTKIKKCNIKIKNRNIKVKKMKMQEKESNYKKLMVKK